LQTKQKEIVVVPLFGFLEMYFHLGHATVPYYIHKKKLKDVEEHREQGMENDVIQQRTNTVRGKARHRLTTAVDGDELLAKKIETCIWNATLRGFLPSHRYWDNYMVRYKYTTKVLGIAFNLQNPKNPFLVAKVTSGEVSPAKLVKMTPYQMFPELWDPIFERVAHKQLRRQLTNDVENAPDGAFTCARCKSKKTTYYQLQTRSADEPLTTFVACVACGKRWKC
jgi:transcription elongation factor S-II